MRVVGTAGQLRNHLPVSAFPSTVSTRWVGGSSSWGCNGRWSGATCRLWGGSAKAHGWDPHRRRPESECTASCHDPTDCSVSHASEHCHANSNTRQRSDGLCDASDAASAFCAVTMLALHSEGRRKSAFDCWVRQLRIAGHAKGGVCDSRASVLLNAQWQHRGLETREHSGRGL